MFGYIVVAIGISLTLFFINECRYHKRNSTLIKIKNRPYKILIHDTDDFKTLNNKHYEGLSCTHDSIFGLGYHAGFINTLSSSLIQKDELKKILFINGEFYPAVKKHYPEIVEDKKGQSASIVCGIMNNVDYERTDDFWYDERFLRKHEMSFHTNNYSVLISDIQYLVNIIDDLLDDKTELITRGYLIGHLEFLLVLHESKLQLINITDEQLITLKHYIKEDKVHEIVDMFFK